jgi:hypothetical protein
MKTVEELAQWVIDNRYPKSEKEKISDLEMYSTIVEWINYFIENANDIKNKSK